MKITIYTINECPYCKTEKEYFASHNLQFEEKNVEQNREFLAEMLEKSNKFAGVPFTIIVNDQGVETPLKGFTKEEFDKVLGFADQAASQTAAPATQTAPVAPAPVADATAPAAPQPPMQDPVQAPVQPMPQAPVETPVVPPIADVPSQPPAPMPPVQEVPPAPVAEVPSVPAESVAPVAPPAPTAPVDAQLNSVMNNLQAMSQGSTGDLNSQAPSIPDLPQDNA